MESAKLDGLSRLFDQDSLSAGLGLRREILQQMTELDSLPLDFLEIAPENWINVGGRFRRMLDILREQLPVTLHGLSLNLGGYKPLDQALIHGVKTLMRQLDAPLYSEHLSYCADDAQLYDLLPIPFTEEALNSTASRIRQVQDELGQRIALENSSYYAPLASELSEVEFICELLERADCDLLLDVNNVYVNSINHRYDAERFIRSLPAARVRYMHVAGHFVEAEDLRVDTHGSDVIQPVFDLLQTAYRHVGVVPTLLERDFNFPSLPQLLGEVDTIRSIQRQSRTEHG